MNIDIETLKTTVLVIDIAIIGLGLLFLLIGFSRGFWKGLKKTICFLIPFVILLLTLDTFASMLLNTNISSSGLEMHSGEYALNVGEYLTDIVEWQIFEGNLANINDTQTYALVTSLVTALARFVVYLIGLIVITIIIAPLIRLFVNIIIRGIFGKKRQKSFLNRTLGIAMGAARFVIFMAIVVVPFFGIAKVTSTAMQDVSLLIDVNNDTVALEDYQKYQKILDKSVIIKTLSIFDDPKTGISIEEKLVGNLFVIKSGDLKVNLIEEYYILRPLIPLMEKFVNEAASVEAITDQDIDAIAQAIKDTKLVKLLLPALLEIGYYQATSIEDLNFASLEGIDLKIETEGIINLINTLLVEIKKYELPDNLQEDGYLEIIENEQFPDSIQNIIDALLDLQTIDSIAIPTLQKLLIDSLEANMSKEDLNTLLSTENIKALLQNDSKTLAEIVQKVLIVMESKDSESGINFKDEVVQGHLIEILRDIFGLTIIKDNEELLVTILVDYLKTDETFAGIEYGDLFEQTIDWELEFDAIIDIVEQVLKIIATDEQVGLDTFLKDELKTKELITVVAQSQIVRILAGSLIESLVNNFNGEDGNLAELFESVNISLIKDMTSDEFAGELNTVFDILVALQNLNIINNDEGAEINLNDLDTLEIIIIKLFNLQIISGNETAICQFILDFSTMSTMIGEMGITLNFENVNWDQEPSKLVAIIRALAGIGDIANFDLAALLNDTSDSEMGTNVGRLFDAFTASDIFGNVVFDIVNIMIDNVGYDIIITEEDKVLINVNTWTKEFEVIFAILAQTKDLMELEDYQNIDKNTVITVMEKASEGVLAAKLVGSYLNEALGADGLDINPIIDGLPKYDFRKQAVLRENAIYIGNLIALTNSLTDLEINSVDNIDDIIQAIGMLDNNDLTIDVLSLIIDENLNDIEIDFEAEASLIEEIFDAYKETTGGETFDINDYPDLKNQLDNSDLARSILEIMGII